MTQFVAELVFASGEVFVHDGLGNDRRGRGGEPLREGEILVTHSGAQAELALADGRTIAMGSNETVCLDASVASLDKPDVEDAAFFVGAADLSRIFQSLGEELEAVTQGLGELTDSSNAHHGFAYLSQVLQTLAPMDLPGAGRVEGSIPGEDPGIYILSDVEDRIVESGVDVLSWTLNETLVTKTPADVAVTQGRGITGETLNLRDLLVDDWNSGSTLDNLSDYLHFERDGGDTVIHISSIGGFKGGYDSHQADQTIILKDVEMMHAHVTDNEMIRSLMEQGRLITD